MQPPRSWNDPSILQQEPFRTEFKRRRAHPSPNEPGKQNVGLVKAMEKAPLKTAAIIWLDHAFRSTTTSGKRVVLDFRTKHIFAHFYWLLSQDEQEALDFLNKEREDRGYNPLGLDSLTSKKNPYSGLKFKKKPEVDTSKTQTMVATLSKGNPNRNQTSKRKTASPLQDGRESKRRVIITPMLGPTEHCTPAQPETLNTSVVECGSRPHNERSKVKHEDNMGLSGAGNQSTVMEEPIECLIPPSRTTPAMHLPFSSEDFIKPEPSSELMFYPCEYDVKQPYASENIGISQSISSNLPHQTTESPRKPPLPRLPLIWAQSRQEVCEAFDWFRSYQGGVYHAHGVAKGYLLSAFSSRRDRFEHGGKLIISHGGGKSESVHCSNGHSSTQPASDQLAQDQSVRALLNSYRNHRPVALVMDDRYALFPYELASKGVVYAVLGFYTITYAWAEYQEAKNEPGRVVRYKFAFRWCEDQGIPWWHDNYTPPVATSNESQSMAQLEYESSSPSTKKLMEEPFDDSVPDMPSQALSSSCEVCRIKSPMVYSIWACLNPECNGFYKDRVEGAYLPQTLSYNPEFLELPPSDSLPPDMVLAPPDPVSYSSNEIVTSYAFTRGLHCSRCGRLSCKFRWDRLECMACAYAIAMRFDIFPARHLECVVLPLSFSDFFLNPISEILPRSPFSFMDFGARGIVRTFTLPHSRGKLHHIQSRTEVGMKEADEIFEQYQAEAYSGHLLFRRWPMRAHKCRGALLTNYFSHNAGEPYQYVGGDANTVPFDMAPVAVKKARDLIHRRIYDALGEIAEFNEVLSAAYMERQRMAFHSDNEMGLGPIVAGLSLGSPALMHFRLHAKHDPG